MRNWIVALTLAAATATASAQAKSDAEVKAEERQARELYDQNKLNEVLPLAQDLHKQRPETAVYEELLAVALLGTSGKLSPEERQKVTAQAKELLIDAKKRGDNSQMVNTLLEKMSPQPGTPAPPADSQAMQDFNAAEKLFGAGDMKGAAELYRKSLDEAPKFYMAALFAGDALFKSGDCPAAVTYYAKAIAIDPNHETAYRYAGDCLMKMNDMTRARDMYVDALLCQPYQQTTRMALARWAKEDHAQILHPLVKLPPGPAKNDKGGININIDPKGSTEDTSGAMMYSMSRALWQGEEFKKEYPKETQYRHSLKEEAEAIRTMLAAAGKNPSDSTKVLQQLDKDGMLECWILLDDADNGIAQDYAAFYLQPGHRDLLHRYVVQYDIHAL